MKNNNIKMKKQTVFRLGSLFVAVSAAVAEVAAANGFTDIPFYLQQKQAKTFSGLKPKVMLLIDDSDMGTWESGSRVNRLASIQKAVGVMLDKYGNQVQWSIQTLNNNCNNPAAMKAYADFRNVPRQIYASRYVPDRNWQRNKNYGWAFSAEEWNKGKCNTNLDDYTENPQEIRKRVNGMVDTTYHTPLTRRYYEVAELVRKKTKYRCEKNAIILMSDGLANSSYIVNVLSTQQMAYVASPDRIRNIPFSELRQKTRHIVSNFDNQFKRWFPTNISPADQKYFGFGNEGDSNTEKVVTNMGIEGGSIAYRFWDENWDRGNGLGRISSVLARKDYKTAGTDGYGKSWNGDPKDPRNPNNPNESLYKNQTIDTYTLRYGTRFQEGIEYMKKGASSSDKYYEVADENKLNEVFAKIFSGIVKSESGSVPLETTSSTPPAVSSRGVAGLAAAVQLNTGVWGGRLQFYRLNDNGTPTDKTQFALPSFTDRQTLINTGSKVYNVGKLTGNEFANADFGLPDMQGGTNKTEWLDLLRWTARIGSDAAIKAKSERGKYSRTYRVRSEEWRDLGDILDAPVVTAGQSEAGGYREFLATAANDGMVHLFVKTAGIHPYSLSASYLPAGMEREDKSGNATTLGKTLKDFADERYGSAVAHNYGVNGGLTMRQTPLSDGIGQRTFVFGAMGQGGRGAYALDVGSLKKGGEPADTLPLFETEKGSNNRLGYTFGTPQVGRVSLMRGDDGKADTEAQVRYAGFLASGYRVQQADAAQNETALYVYDMLGTEAGRGKTKGSISGKAGALLAKIKVDGTGGLSEPALVDTDFDGIVDVAYAGDRGGNMYRFDLRGRTPTQWSVSRIFKGTAQQPVMAAPAVSRLDTGKYVVIFGTGSDVYQDDAQNKARQAVYGIYDDVSAAAVEASSGDLLVQAKRRTNNLITLSDYPKEAFHRGWKVDLDEDGERVVVKPTMILRTAVVTTRKYSTVAVSHTDNETDKCLPAVSSSETSGETAIIGFNAENGGALTDRSARFLPPVNPRNGENGLFHNGVVLKGLLGFAYLDPKRTDESPVTLDGDSGGSGTDSDLDVSPSIPNNRCFREVADRSLLLNSLDYFAVEGPECPKAKKLTRLSWREIFF